LGAGDDRPCWSTIAGLLLIHVAGAAGVVWIVLNPSLPTLALTGAFYVACGLSVTAGYHRLPVACVVGRRASAGAMAKPLDEVGPVPICRRCTRSGRRPAPPLADRDAPTIDSRSSF
jgi:hypothetical protein